MDENRQKRIGKFFSHFRFYIFLAKIGPKTEKTGSEMETGYACIQKQKQINVNGKLENYVRII